MTHGILGACGNSVAEVLRGFDERELAILRSRIVNLTRKKTLQELATEFSITRERVRQIEEAVLSRITRRTQSSIGELLRRASRYLKGVIGAVCPLATILPERTRSGDNKPEFGSDLTLGMLVWLAGPYEFYRGWLVRAPAGGLIALTKSTFRRMAANHEPVDARTVVETLSEMNVHERWALEWLGAVERLKTVSGKICLWNGGLPSKAHLVLRAYGTAMTADGICKEIGESCRRRSLLNCLQSHSDLFRKSGPDLFSLSDWGGDEHTSVKKFVFSEIERAGGRVHKDLLIRSTMTKLAVPKRTVSTTLGNPIFVQSNAGYIRVRTKEDPLPRMNPIEFTKRCYRLSCEDSNHQRVRAWSYRVRVDPETLRGSGTAIPAAFASLLGLRPGERETVTSPFGEVQFSWNGPQASVGSLRSAAKALDASVGDFLYVSVVDKSTVVFSLLRAEELDRASGWERICLHVTGVKRNDKDACIAQVGASIGLKDDEDFSIGDIRRRLEMRREGDLLELVPEAELSEESEDLSELLEYALQR
jgi:hypothetical protein